MADNYLEKKMEEYKAKTWTTSGGKSHKTATTLGKLLVKNRKYDKFDNTVIVRDEHLKSIAGVINKIELVGNIKAEDFSYESVISEKAFSENYQNNLPEYSSYHLSALGKNLQQITQLNAKAFIVVKYNTNLEKYTDPKGCAALYFNLGIIAQSMLLRATEMGLNGNCIYFNEFLRNNEQVSTRFTEDKLLELQNREQSWTNTEKTNDDKMNQLEKKTEEIILEKENSSEGTTLLIIAIGKGTV